MAERPRTDGRRGSWSRQAPSQRARNAGPVRQIAWDVLRAVDAEDAYANLVLPPRLRGLSAPDARLATELTYGTLRERGFYDAVIAACAHRPTDRIDPPTRDLLRLGVHQLLATRIPPHAAVSTTVALAKSRIGSGAAGFVNAVLRRVAERDLEQWREQVVPDPAVDLVASLAVRHSHPPWVVRALRESLVAHGRPATELADLLTADNVPAKVTLVARPGQIEVAELVASGATPGRWSPYAAVLPGGDPGALPAVRTGRARVQDEGSQLVTLALVAAALGPAAVAAGARTTGTGQRWLDLCAGPGGKAALLAGLAGRTGATLVAVEVTEHRAQLVRDVLGPGIEVRQVDGRTVGQDEPGCYDLVLVDAPCTGLGALRRRPEARWRRQPSDLATLGPLQRALLGSAVAALRPGGVVGYVTCSPHPAETLLVVEDLCRGPVDVELLDAPAALRSVAADLPDLGEGPTAQLWPHRHGTDAMFLALLRRTQ